MFFRNIKSFAVELLYSMQEGKREVLAPEISLDNLGFEHREPDQDTFKRQINLIMTLLRKTPWWAKGHLRLGWLALGIKEFDLAYASFEAVRRLMKDQTSQGNANIGLARCYMAKGQYEKAIQLINSLPDDLISEDYKNLQLAACFLAREQYDQAKNTIEQIPKSRRSSETLGVLEFINKQLLMQKS